MVGELRERREKFRGKSEQSTNHKSMEEARYEENLELEGRSEDYGQTSSSEMLRDLESKVSEGLEGEIGQEVVRTDSGGGSGSDSESLKQLANVRSLIGGDDVGDSTVMTKEG